MRADFRARLVETTGSPEIDDVAMLRYCPRHAIVLTRQAMAQRSKPIRDAAVGSDQVCIGAGRDDALVKLAIELVAEREIAIVERDRSSSYQQAETGHRISRPGLCSETNCASFENATRCADVVHLGDRQIKDEGAALRPHHHQAFALELDQ